MATIVWTAGVGKHAVQCPHCKTFFKFNEKEVRRGEPHEYPEIDCPSCGRECQLNNDLEILT